MEINSFVNVEIASGRSKEKADEIKTSLVSIREEQKKVQQGSKDLANELDTGNKKSQESIKKTEQTVTSLDSSVKKTSSNIKQSASTVETSFSSINEKISSTRKTQEDFSNKLDSNTKANSNSLKNLRDAVSNVDVSIDKLSKDNVALGNSFSKYTSESNKNFAQLRDEITRTNLEQDKLKTNNAEMTGSIERNFKKALASAVAYSAGLITIGAAVQGIRSIVGANAEFESGLLGVQKTTGITGDELQLFGQRIRQISTEIPVSTAELLELTQAAGQMGVEGAANLEKFATTVAKLGRVSDMAGEEAAASLAQIITVSGESADSVDVLASVIVKLGATTAATESQIAKMTNEVARSTSVFDVSAAQSAAIAAAMASIGVQAELGGSSVGRSMQAINVAVQSGGEELEKFAETMGMNAEALSETFKEDQIAGFVMFLEAIRDKGLDAAGSLAEIGMEGIFAAKTIIPLAQNLDVLTDTMAAMKEEVANTKAINEEFYAVLGSLQNQWDLFKNKVDNASLSLSGKFSPALTNALKYMNENDGIGTLVNIFETLAVVVGGRLVFALGASTTAKIANAVAAGGLARAEIVLAESSLAEAVATNDSSIAHANQLRVLSATTPKFYESSVAVARLAEAELAAVAATNNLTAAQARLGTASAVATTGSRLMSGAVAMLGGTTGVFMIAAAAVYFYINSLETLEESHNKTIESIQKQKDELAELTESQLTGVIEKTKEQIAAAEKMKAIWETETAFDASGQLAATNETLSELNGLLSAQEEKLNNLKNPTIGWETQLYNVMDANEALFGSMKNTIGGIDDQTVSSEGMIKSLENQIKMLTMTSREQAIFRAELDAINGKEAPENIGKIKALAGQYYDLQTEMGKASSKAKEMITSLATQRAQFTMTAREKAIFNAMLNAGTEATQEERDAIIESTEAIFEKNAALEEMTEFEKLATEAVEEHIIKQNKAADEISDIYEKQLSEQLEKSSQMWEKIDDVARDTWVSIFDSGKSAMDRLEDTIKNGILALLYELTIRKWTIQIATSMSGASVAQQAFGAAGAANKAGGIGGWTGLISGGVGMLNGATDLIANGASGLVQGAKTFGTTGGWNAPSMLAPKTGAGGINYGNLGKAGLNIGAGLVGNYAGNKVGESLFNKEAESAWGATIGGIIGSIGGPLGTLVGSFIGGLVDTAAGGDGKERQNAGILVAPTPGLKDEYSRGTEIFSSGLTVEKMGRRTDDATVETVASQYRTLDSTFTELVKLLGGNLDMTGKSLRGLDEEATPGSSGTFLGRGGNGTDNSDILAQINSYVDQLAENVTGLDEVLLNAVRSASSAEEALKLLADAVQEEADKVTKEITDLVAETLGKDVTTAFGEVGDASMLMRNNFIHLMGGIEELNSTMSSYYQNFFTASERHEKDLEAMSVLFKELGIDIMPQTRSAFRNLVEAQDLSTESGQATAAALLKMSNAFAQVIPEIEGTGNAIEDLTIDLKSLRESVSSAMESAASSYQSFVDNVTSAQSEVDSIREQITAKYVESSDRVAAAQKKISDLNNQSVDAMRKAATGLRDFLEVMDTSSLGGKSNSSQLDATRALYSSQLFAAQNGDADAAKSLPGTVTKLLSLVKDQSKTATEYAVEAGKIRGALDGIADQSESSPEAPQETAMEKAVKELSAAIAEQESWRIAVVQSGASLTRSQETLLEQYATANSALTKAQDELTEANLIRGDLELRQTTALEKFAKLIEDLVAALSNLATAIFASLKAGNIGPVDAVTQLRDSGLTIPEDQRSTVKTSEGPQDVWASSGGALGLYTSPEKGVVDIFAKDGQQFTGAEAVSFVQTQLANNDAMSVYAKAIATGISADSLDALMGWASGTSNGWATANNLPNFEVGTNWVPEDMSANIHQGERIIPKADNSEIISRLKENGNSAAIVDELKALRKELNILRQEQRIGDQANVHATKDLKRFFVDMSDEGIAMNVNIVNEEIATREVAV